MMFELMVGMWIFKKYLKSQAPQKSGSTSSFRFLLFDFLDLVNLGFLYALLIIVAC